MFGNLEASRPENSRVLPSRFSGVFALLATDVTGFAVWAAQPSPLCAQTGTDRLGSAVPEQAPSIDGVTDDWSPGVHMLADEHYFYWRLETGASPFSLQNAPGTVTLWIDADDDPETGYRPATAPDRGIPRGADLVVHYSPLLATQQLLGVLQAWGTRTEEGRRVDRAHFDPDGPAARAGVRIGDVLTAVDGRALAEVPFTDDGCCLIRQGRDTSAVALTVLREGTPIDVTVAPRPALRVLEAESDGVAMIRQGVAAVAFDRLGLRTPLWAGDLDLIASPTVTSTSWELRMSRFPGPEVPANVGMALRSDGPKRAGFLQQVPGGVQALGDLMTATAPPAASGPLLSDARIPPTPDGAIRIVTYNVSSPGPPGAPGAFGRVFRALGADVFLLQEWSDADEASVESWFAEHVDPETEWHAVVGRGESIVSRYPTTPFVQDPTEIEFEIGAGGSRRTIRRAVQPVMATVAAPVGPVAVASIHLQCCGFHTSWQEEARTLAAERIGEAADRMVDRTGAPVLVVGGDYNLVGSTGPLDLIVRRGTATGSPGRAAAPLVLGDRAVYTWRAAPRRDVFGPGHLDHVVVSGADIAGTFILDTGRLSERALEAMDLVPSDLLVSDHLPVVVDVTRSDSEPTRRR